MIADDVVCIGCGYSLRALPNRGRCPECGKPIRSSILLGVGPVRWYDHILWFGVVGGALLGLVLLGLAWGLRQSDIATISCRTSQARPWRARNVLDEARVGSPELAQQRIALLKGLPILDPTEASLEFAEHLVQARIIPRAAAEDAAHVALGTVHGVNYLVTWNLKHIANAFIRPRIEQASRQIGYVPTIICTPEELLDA